MDEIKAVLEKIGSVSEEVNVDAVFGKPETFGDRVLIPVAEIAYGFGVGAGVAPSGAGEVEAGEEEAEEAAEVSEEETEAADGGAAGGAGGGAGAKARPIAYIEVGPDGTKVEPIMDEQKIALAGILLGAWAVGWAGVVLKYPVQKRGEKTRLMERIQRNGLVWYAFTGPGSAFRHACFTRLGGASRGQWASLNLGHTVERRSGSC